MRARLLFVVASLAAGRASAQPNGAGEVSGWDTAAPITAQDVIPEGWVILEGDIAVPVDVLSNRGNYVTNLWSGGIVPFQFDLGVSPAQQAVADLAMTRWEAVANIDFRERTILDLNYVVLAVAPGEFNISIGVGMNGGAQWALIRNWSEDVVVHELGHVLGFWHEQQRANRDEFIEVLYDNALPLEAAFNFNVIPGSRHYGPYDFESIMHYDQCAFSVCGANCTSDLADCRTMLIIDPEQRAAFQNRMGTFTTLSEWDRRIASFMYPPSNWRFVDTTATNLFEQGTFLEPDRSVARGLDLVSTGGRLHILQPTTYDGPSVYSRAMTIVAPLGGLVLR